MIRHFGSPKEEDSMADNTVRGRFVWHELLTPSKAGAHDFYSKAVGWLKQAWDQDPAYTMFAAPSGPLGASIETRDAAPHWRPYIGTLDVDATVAAATRLGARVTSPPTSLPNAGRYAVLSDPQGATFGVHASPTEPRPETDAQHGDFRWHELATSTDPVAAFAFYKELFGWDELGRYDMGPMGTYVLFGRNGKQIGGMFDKGKQGRPGIAYWVGYVRVPDLHATVATVKAAGGKLLTGPMEVPGDDWIAQFSDPHGAVFAVLSTGADLKAAGGAKAAPKQGGAAAKPAPKQGGAAAKPVEKKAKKAAAKKTKKAAKKKVAKKKAPKKKAKKKAAKNTAKKKSAKKKVKRASAKKGKSRKRKAKRRR
jgi:predicted enzyme related to lactoylglutathione lyase